MKIAVFDIDGTLAHTTGYDRFYAQGVSAALRVDLPDWNWADFPHSTDSGIFDYLARRHLGRPAHHAEHEEARASYDRLLARHLRDAEPVNGASACLEHLATEGWHLAVATGNWRRPARRKLRAARIEARWHAFATADDGLSRPAILRHAIESASGSRVPERVVYVGDRPWDSRAAAEVGAAFVGRSGDHRATGKLRTEHCLEHFADSARVVEALESAVVPRW